MVVYVHTYGAAVFHVTDQFGNKLTDEGLIHYIQQVSVYVHTYGASLTS